MPEPSAPSPPVRGGGAGDPPSPECAPAVTGMHAAFARATTLRPDRFVVSSYRFAGHGVRLRIVGRDLAVQIGRPFAHLEINETVSPTTHLTIDLWDEEETGVLCPVASTDAFGSGWTIRNGVTRASPDGRYVGHQLRQSINWLDRKAQHVVGWTASSKQLSLYERGKPLHVFLSVWYNDREVQMVHAGLVSKNGKGVLFPGMGGAGKSTSALACLCAGFDYLGDDYIGLQALAEGSFVGHSLYNSTWLEPEHISRFPSLLPHAIPGTLPQEEKSLILLSHVFPKRLARSAPISVLALPRIVDTHATRFRPASKGEALLALAPTSMLALPFRTGVRGFERLARLVEHVPRYWLELGRDLSQIPRRVDELLAEVTG